MRNSVLFALFVLCMAACQQEDVTLEQTSGIVPSSPLNSLLMRVSQNPTAIDNLLDGTSCFSVDLPVVVVANNQQLTISDASGYAEVADIFNQSTTDVDSLDFIFPITITFQNFQQQEISSQPELNNVLAACGDDDGLDEIPCVVIQYPVTINTYDPVNQQAGSITLQSNAHLFNFLVSASQMVLEVVYPVTVTVSGGTAVLVGSNIELSDVIESAIGTCNPGGGGTEPVELDDILISGPWYVSYYYHNEDETDDYQGYSFSFNANGTVTAIRNGNTYGGTWDVHLEGSTHFLDIDFDSSNLGDLDDDWRVLEFSAQTVRLRQDGGGSDPDRLHFTKI